MKYPTLSDLPDDLTSVEEFRRWIIEQTAQAYGIPGMLIHDDTSPDASRFQWSGHNVLRTAQPVRPWRPAATGDEIPIDENQTLIVPRKNQ